ncbi:hypothetical protein LTS18_008634, partial [Coniosporium uncinatum]
QDRDNYLAQAPHQVKKLDRLHTAVPRPVSKAATSIAQKKPAYSYATGEQPSLSFLPRDDERKSPVSDYGDSADLHDLPSPSTLTGDKLAATMKPLQSFDHHPEPDHPDTDPLEQNYGDTDSLMEDAMIGLADSQDLRSGEASGERDFTTARAVYEEQEGLLADVLPSKTSLPGPPQDDAPRIDRVEEHSLFLNGTSSSAAGPAALQYESTAGFKRSHVRADVLSATQPPSKKAKYTAASFRQESVPDSVVEEEVRPMGGSPELMPKDHEGIEDWILKEFGGCIEIVG